MSSSETTKDEQIHPQSYFRWTKQDFFPEESFQNWRNYRHALSHIPLRFKDRLLARSQDSDETEKLRKQSENDMKRCLTWWDLMWFGFGAVIGAGIFVLTGQQAHENAGPAIVLSYVASGFSAMLSVFCYTEFAVEIPVAGGSFAYLRVELGDFAAFVTAGNILLECVLGSAAVARAWTSYFASLINREPDSLRIHTGLADGYNLLDPIAVIVLAIAATIAMSSTRNTSVLNWIASAVNTLVILFVIVAGFLNADTSNMKPFAPHGVEGVFQAAAIVYFAYGGFDTIATMAEETKNPSRDIPLGLLGSMSIITIIYCLMALSLTMMQKYTDIDPNAAYSVAFERVGMKWAKYLVALGALKGMTTVLLVGALGQARYITHIARAHMIPPWFALVHPKTKTPINATLLMTISSACITFFSSLDILAKLLSLSTLFVFMMMAVALLVRRYYVSGVTPRTSLLKLVGFLLIIISSSIGISACWGLDPSGWVGYAVTVPLWFLGTLGISMLLPQQRTPKVWGVPLVPWLPSLSIATNLFLMGSLGYMAFVRFGICTVIMLVYYVFFGLHATYDMAHQQTQV
ncbi:putative amino acid/polyamine transporter I, cationic amino acid transporter [Helianthus annuus]|uniref:Amino acid/polyamine transporter I, cationic amino acid transporter n=1 Tax=Helianthus annuus TaxID=4232 RepID=A0A251SGZ1_HELAN|nr:cationic amino acid transporter 5 [Helianthus annuus]KAF5768769.1 putative amino acid/polyamine transporter I, cationic amino acid transporter [Helianthus annuus]KAJ0463939.1 putative amino acid/polyamine transporter I, cationic amino acid transporter [Helianthus annuus]KAJ0485440.1 putative amino acid/polyamine transporter I, cationic amino acid transporter [Helianthus annuus]KAJ0655991.1 putative amino acid/polyamine transporter I, cationic amino acid transporter [Helianthus annuus]KAJ065